MHKKNIFAQKGFLPLVKLDSPFWDEDDNPIRLMPSRDLLNKSPPKPLKKTTRKSQKQQPNIPASHSYHSTSDQNMFDFFEENYVPQQSPRNTSRDSSRRQRMRKSSGTSRQQKQNVLGQVEHPYRTYFMYFFHQLYKNWIVKEYTLSMNKMSLAVVIIGFFFVSSLLFVMGFLVAVNVYDVRNMFGNYNVSLPTVTMPQVDVQPGSTAGAKQSSTAGNVSAAQSSSAQLSNTALPAATSAPGLGTTIDVNNTPIFGALGSTSGHETLPPVRLPTGYGQNSAANAPVQSYAAAIPSVSAQALQVIPMQPTHAATFSNNNASLSHMATQPTAGARSGQMTIQNSAPAAPLVTHAPSGYIVQTQPTAATQMVQQTIPVSQAYQVVPAQAYPAAIAMVNPTMEQPVHQQQMNQNFVSTQNMQAFIPNQPVQQAVQAPPMIIQSAQSGHAPAPIMVAPQMMNAMAAGVQQAAPMQIAQTMMASPRLPGYSQ